MSFNHPLFRSLLAGAVVLLAACGQKGPLFMDTPPPENTAPATVAVDAAAQAEDATEEVAEQVDASTEEAASAETTLEVREQLQDEQPAE